MSMIGANLEQMLTLAVTFERDAAAVGELRARITNTLASTSWTGRVSDTFRDQWNSQFSSTLGQLQDALLNNARVVRATSDGINAVANGG